MRAGGTGGKLMVIGSLLALGLPLGSHAAHAARSHGAPHGRSSHAAEETRHAAAHGGGRAGTASRREEARLHPGDRHHGRAEMRFAEAETRHGRGGHHGVRYAEAGESRGGYISCVPFAREESGIEVAGNAYEWWDNAAGQYARGSRPEAGSVLNFRANGHMRLGHVAVVTEVDDSRHVLIDHANWSGPGARRGGVSRAIEVVDVSADNDWSAVRVALGHSGEYGSVYPTYGFIYDRPDHGTMVANTVTPAGPAPAMNPAPRDLRPSVQRAAAYDEVAEAPETGAPETGARHRGLDLSLSSRR